MALLLYRSHSLAIHICPQCMEEISHTLYNQLSLTCVTFIQENLDQKRSQTLVILYTVEQSNNLKSYKSSEISFVKRYFLHHQG